jgi:hypothetical protein
MRLIQIVRQLRVWLHYRRAAFVNTREELEAAMRLMPPRIVVDGDEALRAFAAGLLNGDQEVATQPQADSTAPLIVSPIGRIRDGYRKRRKPKAGSQVQLKGGLDIVLVAATGVCAALVTEWLAYPVTPRMIERPHGMAHGRLPEHMTTIGSDIPVWSLRLAMLVFGAIAIASFGWVLWQALGLGLPLKTGWRLEYRIQGRLVMARVRRRPV